MTARARTRRPGEIGETPLVRGWPLLLLLVAATLAAYQPAWRGSPLWDDEAHLTRTELQSADGLHRIWLEPGATQQYYPLTHSAFWLFHRMWGDDTLGYHLASAALHATSAFLLAAILARLAVPWPWLAALIFALHPVHVESVAWISELKNTLSGTLCLAAALAWWRFDETRRRRPYALALALFALALLSKTTTAMLPALLLIAIWWRRGRVDPRGDLLPLAPLFLLAAAFGSLTIWAEHTLIGARGTDFHLGGVERLLLAGRAFWFYLGKLTWPANLTFVYPRWHIDGAAWWQYLSLLAAAGLVAVSWRARARSRAPLAALAAFSVALFPALGFFDVYPFRYSYVADHFQYLASLGFAAFAAGSLATLAGRLGWRGRRAQAAIALVIAGPLALLTWRQAHDYSDAASLYRATIARNPAAWMAYNNLAVLALAESSERAMALVDRALAHNPDYPEAHNNRGLALQMQGRFEEAAESHRRALALEPDFADAHNNLGVALQRLGRREEAAAEYREVIRIRPNWPHGYANLGLALVELGRPAEAMPFLDQALRIDATIADVQRALAGALEGAGRGAEALPHYEAVARLLPGDARARLALGDAFYRSGDAGRAFAEYSEALRLGLATAEVHNNLGASLERLGRLSAAIDHYREAVKLAPDSPGARLNLERALARAGGPGS